VAVSDVEERAGLGDWQVKGRSLPNLAEVHVADEPP
jgi:hypothetical protein